MTAYNKFLWEKIRPAVINILRLILILGLFYSILFLN